MGKDMSWHWAYRPENECILAKFRRHIEENDVSGWKVVVDWPQTNYKIMKLETSVFYKGKRCQVLFLEAWYYRGEERFQVNKLFIGMEDCT